MGQQEMAMTGKNRIYGPKNDGTYVVEFRTAEGAVGDLNPAIRGGGDPAFPGADAVWAVRAR